MRIHDNMDYLICGINKFSYKSIFIVLKCPEKKREVKLVETKINCGASKVCINILFGGKEQESKSHFKSATDW